MSSPKNKDTAAGKLQNAQPHDAIFKAIFGRKDIVQSYIKAYLPQELVSNLQLDAIGLDSETYVDEGHNKTTNLTKTY